MRSVSPSGTYVPKSHAREWASDGSPYCTWASDGSPNDKRRQVIRTCIANAPTS